MRLNVIKTGSRRTRLLIGAGATTLVVSGAVFVLPYATSSATTSLPPLCPNGQYQPLPGKPSCDPGFTNVPYGMNPANVSMGKQKAWQASQSGRKAAYEAVSKGILPKPIPLPPQSDYVTGPNGTIEMVNFHGVKVASQISVAPLQMVSGTFNPPFSPVNIWTGWSGNLETQVIAGGATEVGAAKGPAGVVVRTMIESVPVSPTSGVLVPGPVNGQFFVTPKVSGSLKIIGISGDVLKLNLIGTNTYYYFNTSNFTYQPG